MTIASDTRRRPAFTIGDRLRKARTTLGPDVDVKAFSELLGVGKNTVTNYELERTAPENMKPIVLRQWAMATGVDLGWLVNGDTPPSGDGGASWYTPRDLNPEPTDSGPDNVTTGPWALDLVAA